MLLVTPQNDVLSAIAQGVRDELGKFGQFNFTTQSRYVKGRGWRVELTATQEYQDYQTLAFKILFEGDRLRLVDDGFDIGTEDFTRRSSEPDFHTYSEYEYANPSMLDDLYSEIERRFVDG